MRLLPKLIVPALLAPVLLALCVSTASPARAQLPAETLLRLAESAEVTRPPDELRATLRAETRAATAAAAQAAINRAVAAALGFCQSSRQRYSDGQVATSSRSGGVEADRLWRDWYRDVGAGGRPSFSAGRPWVSWSPRDAPARSSR